MLQLRSLIAGLVACAISLGASTTPAQSLNSPSSQTIARLTAKHGEVLKREFVDWNRNAWGAAEPVNVDDPLREGMLIATGNQSWAEVAWPSVKTRAWSNTTFAVAPNKRLVYLTGGEMLFRLSKDRKDKDKEYLIWTKVLQARIRGTTVLVQTNDKVSRISVLEGKIDVYNRLDHSTISLEPGSVYEIKAYDTTNNGTIPAMDGAEGSTPKTEGYKPKAITAPKNIESTMRDIAFNSRQPVHVFKDVYAITNIYAANKDAILEHPLVAGDCNGQIDSLPLIKAELGTTPGYGKNADSVPMIEQDKLTRIACNAAQIKAVPSNTDYFIGPAVGKTLTLPQVTQLSLQPRGVIMPLESPSSQAKPNLAAMHATPKIVPFATKPASIFDPAAPTAEDDPAVQLFTNPKSSEDQKSPLANSTPIPLPPFCATNASLNGATGSAFDTAPGVTVRPFSHKPQMLGPVDATTGTGSNDQKD